MIVLPGSAVPVTVVPSSETSRLPAGCGGVESGAVTVPEGPLFPALSIAIAVSASPFCNACVSVKVNLPLLSAVTVPSTVPSLLVMVTVLPASAFPEITSPSAEIARSVIAPGAWVSTTKVKSPDTTLVLPALSVAVTVSSFSPSASEDGGLKLQLPEASTVVVPRT